MKKHKVTPKIVENGSETVQESSMSHRHRIILARDDNALATHQAVRNRPKTGLFEEYQQYDLPILQ